MNYTAATLLRKLRELDVRLRTEQGQLRVSAPRGVLTAELEAALRANKAELLALLVAEQTTPAPITRVSRDEPLRLSYFQERLWMLDQMRSGDTSYVFASIAEGAGSVDIERLVRAIRRVVAENEILRTRYVLDGSAPVARIGRAEATPIIVRDVCSTAESQPGVYPANSAQEAAHEPFDLANEAPIRFTILKSGPQSCSLLIAAHHIAMDAWSLGLLRRMIGVAYEDDNAADGVNDDVTRLQYADFAGWERQNDANRSSLQFWSRALARLPQYSTFNTDRERREDVAPRGAVIDFVWPAELYQQVRSAAQSMQATLYMMLLSAVAATLSRATGQTDVALGSPIGTRDQAVLEGMLGPIVNLMVVRTQIEEESTFADVVARVRSAVLDAHSHMHVPFERIVQEVNPGRAAGSSPLFQVAVVLHSVPDAAASTIEGGGAIYDLTVFATEREGTLHGALEYRTDLYDASTIQRIIGWMTSILTAAVANPNERVSALPMMPAAESSALVRQMNGAPVPVDRRSFVEQFIATAAQHADQVAVRSADVVLTYRALHARAALVARALRRAGAGKGSLVALATDRTADAVVGVVGILMSGAGYVPVDVSYPSDRIAFMLRDSEARHLVANAATLAELTDVELPQFVVRTDETLKEAAAAAPHDISEWPAPSDPAYLIYTSGSTGRPKGVSVPHSALSNFFSAMQQILNISSSDRIVSVTPLSFDISILEVLFPLVHGASTIVASRDDATDGERLASLIAKQSATIVQSTPSGWRLLMNTNWNGSSRVTAIAGGESVPTALVEWLAPRVARFFNGYGPTETTVYSTMGLLSPGTPVTIGRPVANTRVYLLDSVDHPVPVGVPGEICIAGDGVALGYHRHPELTLEKFVADPFENDSRMYRTGDVGRWTSNGELVHLGRVDGQVKLRGYRIETAEVERALEQHESVRTAVVGLRNQGADNERLVAWVELHDNRDSTPSELRAHLRTLVPAFMIPSMVRTVEQFPVTPSGKIDRTALPDPFASAREDTIAYIAPSTTTEVAIAEVWARLLGIARVGVNDGFFELGGHSLLAMMAAREISAALGQSVEPRLLFFRTLGQLADACDNSGVRAVATT